MGSEANDVERLFDALEDLRLLLAESLPAGQQTKHRSLSARRLGADLLSGFLRFLSESAKRLHERTTLRWRECRNQIQQKRNTFRLLIVSGAIRTASVEFSCDGSRTTCPGIR